MNAEVLAPNEELWEFPSVERADQARETLDMRHPSNKTSWSSATEVVLTDPTEPVRTFLKGCRARRRA